MVQARGTVHFLHDDWYGTVFCILAKTIIIIQRCFATGNLVLQTGKAFSALHPTSQETGSAQGFEGMQPGKLIPHD